MSVLVILATGTTFYTLVEGWTVIEALYFTVITLTTIGYGDLHPTTEFSRLFTDLLRARRSEHAAWLPQLHTRAHGQRPGRAETAEGQVGRYWVSEETRPIVSCPVAS